MRLGAVTLALSTLLAGSCRRTPAPADPALAPSEPQTTVGIAISAGEQPPEPRQPAAEVATVRYRVPPGDPAPATTSAGRWGLAAPVTGGFSDPNAIAYDQAHADRHIDEAMSGLIKCGSASYRIATPGGVLEVRSGLDAVYLGQQFRAADLVRFLETRAGGRRVERAFRVAHPDAAKLIREGGEGAAHLRRSPWDRDTQTVVSLLMLARHKPAYPPVKALLKDPSPAVRASAVHALAGLAPDVREAVGELTRLLPDGELGAAAATALGAAGPAGVTALIEAMDHPDHAVRNRAVFALPWVHPFEAALPGVLAALNHRDREVQRWGLSVVIDLQGRGVSVARDEVVDALALRLAGGDYDSRSNAAIALVNLKGAAARARPALAKAAKGDPGIANYARVALKAIDTEAPERR